MKGILFSEALFPLVVNGSKTQTRRIIKPQPILDFIATRSDIESECKPRYKVFEIVYLKEPWIDDSDYFFTVFPVHETMGNNNGMLYRYGNDDSHLNSVYGDLVKWKNKLFMPENAARYFIEITAVRAERLQDISEEDCIKEGIESHTFGWVYYNPKIKASGGMQSFSSPIKAYASLIDSINGKGTWESNPFVWVYDFKMATNPELLKQEV